MNNQNLICLAESNIAFEHKSLRRCYKGVTNKKYFNAVSIFRKNLEKAGYTVKKYGHYIVAEKAGKTKKYYFSSHDERNIRYMVSIMFDPDTSGYIFFNKKDRLSMLDSEKVKNHIIEILKDTKPTTFNSKDGYVFFTDFWVQQNAINY